MHARVTLLEIDLVRVDLDTALAEFTRSVVPRLREQPGYRGVYAMSTPEGKALLMSLWDSAETADASAEGGFYPGVLSEYAMLFRAPPGRERYEIRYVDLPAGVT